MLQSAISRTVALGLIIGMGVSSSVQASSALPVLLEPLKHRDASLTIVDDQGVSHSYTPAELEEWPTFRMETTTPWRDEAAEFDGVMLSDILASHGLDDNSSILVVAENDFAVTIPVSGLKEVPILVATRVDGRAHSRRARGPIQFVISAEDVARFPDQQHENHMVWMAARIAPVSE